MEKFHQSRFLLQSCRKERSGAEVSYFTPRWLLLYGYILTVLVTTPYLPLLIRWVSSRWPAESIASFVLGVEISIGVLCLVSAAAVLLFNRPKFSLFVLIMGWLIGASCLFYYIIPNPYELTHLPEYAIMSILIIQALKELEGKRKQKVNEKYVYFRSAMIVSLLGFIDELYQGILPLRYFTWYDIFLNGLGGVLGLTIFWGMSKE